MLLVKAKKGDQHVRSRVFLITSLKPEKVGVSTIWNLEFEIWNFKFWIKMICESSRCPETRFL
jgi:hypothetical protein